MTCRVLIVEDDMNFRYAIRETIKWQGNGFEIVGEAIHGRQALVFLEKTPVDLVLTDMSMPLMNGVELTKEIRKRYPEVVIVALSAYDDFQFVKESLKYGAKDYILKQDMDPEEIVEILKKAWEENLAERENVSEEEKRRYEIRYYMQGMGTAKEETGRYLDSLLKGRLFFLLLIWRRDQSAAIQNLERLKGEEILYKAGGEEGEVLAICRLEPVKSELACRDQIKSRLEGVAAKLEGEALVLGSRQSDRWEDLPLLYSQVKELLSIRLYFRKGKAFSYQEYEFKLKNREISCEYQDLTPESLETEEGIRTAMAAMEKHLYEKMPEEEALNRYYLHFCRAAVDGKASKADKWNAVEFYERILKLETLAEKREYTLKAISQEWEKAEEAYRGKSPEIGRVIQYIHENYKKEITLSDVAGYVGLSVNYLSNLFKTETGENLTYFINKIRIAKAKQLLDTTTMKVYEVAEAVGYRNVTYFYTVFKKITKMAVSDYRNEDQL